MELLITLIFIYFQIIFCNANNTILSTTNDKELLAGLTLRVSSYERPPFLASRRGEGGRTIHTGIMADFIEALSGYFQMRLVYVPVSQTDVARNGTPTTLIHQLQHEQVDIGSFLFTNILEYLKVIDLSYPIFIDEFILMQPFPNETSRLSDPIKPFTGTVWYLFIISNAVFAGMITAIIYSRQLPSFHENQGQRTSLREQFYRQLEYVQKMISSQGSSTLPELKRFLSFRLMIALWLLMMVVLNNSYSGIYTANMAVPKLEPTVDTLEELAASNKFRMTIELNTDIGFKALEAKSGPFKVFGDTFRRNPELLFTRPLDAITNVVQQNCVYPGPRNLINYYISADLKSHNGECRLSIATKPLPYYLSYSLGLQKGSPYTQIMNQKFFLRMWENGIILGYMKVKYFPPVPARCLATDRKPGGPTPLKLDDFAGAFVLLLIGYGLAKLVFIAELISNRFNEKRAKK